MAETRTGAGAVDSATLLADFVIPATVDLLLAGIDSRDINLENLDAMFAKVSKALHSAAQQNVTADMAPYEPQESLYLMPEVTLLQHQIMGTLTGDDVSYSVEPYYDDGGGKVVDHQALVPKAAATAPKAPAAPAPRSSAATTASVNALKAAAILKRPEPVQENRAPSLTPSYNRRKSDRQPKVSAKTQTRVKAPPEPKLKLPRGVKSVNETIRFDVIICLEDGKKVADLGTYLAETHKLTPEAYRQKWSLPAEYPMKSPKLILNSGHIRQYQPVTGTFVPVH
jgi:predicted transcriptional regulator